MTSNTFNDRFANDAHRCTHIGGCDETVPFDDEPYCFVHSPDSGSHFPGYSYKAIMAKQAEPKPTWGMCTSCGAIEVELNNVTGYRDLSYMGEDPNYPVGSGCEVCN